MNTVFGCLCSRVRVFAKLCLRCVHGVFLETCVYLCLRRLQQVREHSLCDFVFRWVWAVFGCVYDCVYARQMHFRQHLTGCVNGACSRFVNTGLCDVVFGWVWAVFGCVYDCVYERQVHYRQHVTGWLAGLRPVGQIVFQ